jgi:hypothetical protein
MGAKGCLQRGQAIFMIYLTALSRGPLNGNTEIESSTLAIEAILR